MQFKIPEDFDRKELNEFMQEMIKELHEKEKDKNITYCGQAANWFECFNGFLKNDGTFHLCLHYNIGRDTKGFMAIYKPK